MENRVPEWPEILSEKVDEAAHKPFKRGHHDCCTWVAEVVKAISGTSIGEDLLGEYDTLTEAKRLLREYEEKSDKDGVEAAFEIGMKENGFEEIENLSFTKRGDVVLVETDEGTSPAVCIGQDVALVSRHGGLRIRSLDDAFRGWRI